MSEAQMSDARSRYAKGEGLMELARAFKVAHTTLRKALLGHTYKAVR